MTVTCPFYTLTLSGATSYNPTISRHCWHKKIMGGTRSAIDLIGEFKEIIYPEGEVKIPAPDTKGNAG